MLFLLDFLVMSYLYSDDSFFSEPIPKAHSTLVEQQLGIIHETYLVNWKQKFYVLLFLFTDIQPNPRTTKIRKTPPQGRIKCKECDKKYGRYYLKIHMRLHTGEKLITCNCHKKTFPSKGLYKQYHKYHSEHACPTCQKVFTTRIELNFHRRDHFPKPPRFNCSICGKGFLKIVNYKRHSHTHDSTMLMACKLCSKTFSETDDLIAHYEQHEKNIKHKISELKKV